MERQAEKHIDKEEHSAPDPQYLTTFPSHVSLVDSLSKFLIITELEQRNEKSAQNVDRLPVQKKR